MRQKLITLDPTSWDLASKKKNFSEWVRRQLRKEESINQDLTNALDDSDYWQERYRTCKNILFKERLDREYQDVKE